MDTVTRLLRQFGILVCGLTVSSVIVGDIVSPVAVAQARGSETVGVKELIARLRKEPTDGVAVRLLGSTGSAEAVPILKETFDTFKDNPYLRLTAAAALVRLHVSDTQYWRYLESLALEAVGTDAPYPVVVGKDGKATQSPEFLKWAKDRDLKPEAAAWDQLYGKPPVLIALAQSYDQRAIPLLRQGILARNPVILSVSARGLALLQYLQSIPTIIHACMKASAEEASSIAHALVFFDDDRAQAAAARFIKNPELLDELRQTSKRLGPDGVF